MMKSGLQVLSFEEDLGEAGKSSILRITIFGIKMNLYFCDVETLIMRHENKEQLAALKAFAKALKVSFKTDNSSAYDPLFVAKVLDSEKAKDQGEKPLWADVDFIPEKSADELIDQLKNARSFKVSICSFNRSPDQSFKNFCPFGLINLSAIRTNAD